MSLEHVLDPSAIAQSATESSLKRTMLLQATFDEIADTGFEGLRTRQIAERAAMNVATLHYYFPTKQALIEAEAEFLGEKFQSVHGPAPEPTGYPALDMLRQEFSDGRYYTEEEPRMMLVLHEFVLRSGRDPEVQKIVEQMHAHWCGSLMRIVKQGIREGTFRSDLDPQQTVEFLASTLYGVLLPGNKHMDAVQTVVERWLLSGKVLKALESAEK